MPERVKRTLKPKAQDSGQFLLADVLVCVLSIELVPATASLLSHNVLVNMSHAAHTCTQLSQRSAMEFTCQIWAADLLEVIAVATFLPC